MTTRILDRKGNRTIYCTLKTTTQDVNTTATQGNYRLKLKPCSYVSIQGFFIQFRAKGSSDVETEEDEMLMLVSCSLPYC